ncbi:MAG TPA: hypothetical protein VEF55_01415 [Candidatus Binatia bacterium]|nr:hypothetical protein [Candidatus Binatia bacterium]
MWPYGSIEPPLGEQAPTYADLLDAHWDALPRRRRLEILLYLARRLLRYPPREIAAWSVEVAEDVRDAMRRWRQAAGEAAAELRWALTPEGRSAIGDFIESLATYRAVRDAAPILALAIVLMMLTGVDHTTFRSSTERSVGDDSIVEQARAVRHHYPPRCYYEADGDVIVMDSTWRAIRPYDPQRARLLAQFCQ